MLRDWPNKLVNEKLKTGFNRVLFGKKDSENELQLTVCGKRCFVSGALLQSLDWRHNKNILLQ